MAISDNKNEQAAAQQQAAPQVDFGQSTARASTGLFSDFQSLFSLPINSSQGSELLNTAVEKFEAQVALIFKGSAKDIQVDLIPIDRELNKAVSHSVIVVAMSAKTHPQLGVTYHSLLLEGSAEDPEVINQNIAGMNVEIRRSVSDAINRRLRDEVVNAVKARFGDHRRLIDAEYSVMPRGFDLEDEAVTRRLIANALMACRNIMAASVPDWRDMNIAFDLPQRDNLSARVSYNRNGEQLRDDANLPIRSDVRIDLSTPDSNDASTGQRADLLSVVTGFVDLVYAPTQQASTPYGAPQSMGPIYLPRFIITGFESNRARSVGSQLLALANAILLYSNNDALAVLYPNTAISVNEVDMHDIGVLNYEAKLVNTDGKFGYVDLKSASVEPQDVAAYIRELIRPTFELGIDVSGCGADTWVRSPFASAALGDAKATQTIIDAANTLTNGMFASFWNPQAPIARVDSRTVLGKYQDKNGNWRDIRDVDYLAVLGKFGDKNMQAVWEWSGAKNNPGMNIDQAAFIQRRTIESIVSNPVYTGHALRVIFNPQFLEALSHSLKQAGLGVRLSTPSMNQMQQRYVPTNIPTFDSAQIIGGLAQTNFATPQGGFGHGYGAMGRFG